MVEIAECGIVWAPGVAEPLKVHQGVLLKLDKAGDDEAYRSGEYSVLHYAPQALGQAFGPLALDQTVRFCCLLDKQIAAARGRKVIVATTPGDIASRANKAVLLGAYLLLRKAWSLREVCAVLGDEGRTGFPCSWHARGIRQADRRPLAEVSQKSIMKVKDVWAALELARDCGWIESGEAIADEVSVNLLCSQYRWAMLEYDAVWLVPASVLVAADPMTTVRDPNPITCSTLESGDGENKNRHGSISSLNSSFTNRSNMMSTGPASPSPQQSAPSPMKINVIPTSDQKELVTALATQNAKNNADVSIEVLPDPESTPEGRLDKLLSDASAALEQTPSSYLTSTVAHLSEAQATVATDTGERENCGADLQLDAENADAVENYMVSGDISSCHTVCKFQQGGLAVPHDVGTNSRSSFRKAPKDFISWCEDQGVSNVVRVNADNEAGIVEFGGSYDPSVFRRHYIDQVDIPVVDKNGGVPGPRDIAKVIDSCNLRENPGAARQKAILVHCKGGFGRSVVFACCIIIWEKDIPGRQLLAWARVVRPGAITTPAQEEFLCSLSGREDLRKYITIKPKQQQSCCSVQ